MSGARQGRRRRILQDEVLSASRELTAYSVDEATLATGAEGRRYALDDGSLGGALARRHFPSRIVAPAGVVGVGVAATVALAALHHFRHAISGTLGEQALALCDAISPTSLATWLTASTMLVSALLGAMILAVRRRRVDDYHGTHRLWRGAVVAALLLSIDAVTNVHTVAAGTMANLTGIRLLTGGAEWWLAFGTLALGWVGMRVLLDVKESKLALFALLVAMVAGGVAAIGPLTFSIAVVAKLAQVLCYLFVAASLLAYMRFLHHDVAAGIASKPQKSRSAEVKLATATVEGQTNSDADRNGSGSTRRSKSHSKPKAEIANADSITGCTEWTDGSDGYEESYDDENGSRKLSKSERKRLRQQRAERRAA